MGEKFEGNGGEKIWEEVCKNLEISLKIIWKNFQRMWTREILEK